MKETAYQVRTSVFEGPMELLLSLIEKRKLFINEISIAEVTDDYLTHVKGLTELPITQIANFIIVAATLILIKSRSLLPEITLSEEEETSIGDLEKRLSLYQVIRDISSKIKDELSGPTIWERPFSRNKQVVFSPDPSFTVINIHQSIKSVIANLPQKEIIPSIAVKKVISIEEMIESITKRMENELSLSFKKLSGHSDSKRDREQKVYVIVGFLALLELVKQGLVMVQQSRHFEDIDIKAMEHANKL